MLAAPRGTGLVDMRLVGGIAGLVVGRGRTVDRIDLVVAGMGRRTAAARHMAAVGRAGIRLRQEDRRIVGIAADAVVAGLRSISPRLRLAAGTGILAVGILIAGIAVVADSPGLELASRIRA